jgi:hypothetical protein
MEDNYKLAYRNMIDTAFNRYLEKNYEGNKQYAEISRESLEKLRTEIRAGI